MKRLCIGASEHSDLLLGICRLAALAGKRVLLVDGTLSGRITCIVASEEGPSLVRFGGFDVACLFPTLGSVISHLEEMELVFEEYELVLVDTDQLEFLDKLQGSGPKFDGLYITTAYDKFTLHRTVNLIRNMDAAGKLPSGKSTVVIRNAVDCNIDEDYVDMLLAPLPFNRPEFYRLLPFDEVDLAVLIDSGHQGTIELRRMSRSYRKVLVSVAHEVTGEEVPILKRMIKQAMRRKIR
ncbi:hypothetical protein [Paenibacillus lutrae]|uniref:Uncharacterized protein n=1 Tax=Paenibacillus lutrae TaxID=2078573 RepID=A0A7X3FGL7_9BACL|nr:hypothetical protein [Paenibacillus lutrae]MVO99292.1 hypothetical protein [Paenibacillus lutrae]